MHPHFGSPLDHHQHLLADARRDRLAAALRRQARARRLRRRADELERDAARLGGHTVT